MYFVERWNVNVIMCPQFEHLTVMLSACPLAPKRLSSGDIFLRFTSFCSMGLSVGSPHRGQHILLIIKYSSETSSTMNIGPIGADSDFSYCTINHLYP